MGGPIGPSCFYTQEMIRRDHGNVAGETDDTNGLHDKKNMFLSIVIPPFAAYTPLFTAR